MRQVHLGYARASHALCVLRVYMLLRATRATPKQGRHDTLVYFLLLLDH